MCSARVTTAASNPGLYYECPSSGCVVVAESLPQQVPNPGALFPTDNNGVILEIPAVTAPEASVSGSLVFGIGTQSDNALNQAVVYTLDQNLSATNQGLNGVSGEVEFSVANADSLFKGNATAFVSEDLAGPNSLAGFDWGLPFFIGRNEYTAIEGKSTPGGNGPHWAY